MRGLMLNKLESDIMDIRVKIFKEPNAVLPKKRYSSDAGMDVTAISKQDLGDRIIYGTGLYFDLEPNTVMKIFPRSSIYKTNLQLTNSVGILDAGYTGELKFIFNKLPNKRTFRNLYGLKKSVDLSYNVGDRIGQIIIEPIHNINITEVSSKEDLSDTDRGTGGFGSTGK